MSDLSTRDDAEQVLRETIMGTIAGVATKARCHPLWVMGLVEGENANILRSDLDKDSSGEAQIHAYMITRINGGHSRDASGPVPFSPSNSKSLKYRVDAKYTFRIRGVRFFHHSGSSSSATASENDFKKEVAKWIRALHESPKLAFDRSVSGHDLVQIEGEGFTDYGNKLCHQGDYTITVGLIQAITPKTA